MVTAQPSECRCYIRHRRLGEATISWEDYRHEKVGLLRHAQDGFYKDVYLPFD